MEKKKYTRKDITRACKELNAEGKQVSKNALNRKGINDYWIYKLIIEGLTDFKKQLGLKITPQEEPHSKSELLEKIDGVVSELKRIPTWRVLRHETKITDKVFNRNFGKKGIPEVFSHYREWLKNSQPESKNIKLVDEYLERQSNKIPRLQLEKKEVDITKTKYLRLPGRKEFGGRLNFRNLIYEPTNEQGVVLLFGMVSERLGFSIERIGTEFPDCEAKRYIKGRHPRQQPVKIEFEYYSRDYDHPIEGCDIIVCWKDNWGNKCPLEVIELSNEIKKLQKLLESSNK